MKTLWIEDEDALNVGRVIVTKTGTKDCTVCYSCDERDEYENRLKADMVAMLTELKNELIDKSWNIDMYDDNLDFECCYLNDIYELIQQKIDKYKAESEGK